MLSFDIALVFGLCIFLAALAGLVLPASRSPVIYICRGLGHALLIIVITAVYCSVIAVLAVLVMGFVTALCIVSGLRKTQPKSLQPQLEKWDNKLHNLYVSIFTRILRRLRAEPAN